MLKDAGGAVIAVCVDTPAESKKVVERYKIAFDIVSDAGAKTIKEYGLVFKEPMGRGDIAIPANFLIDKNGKVAWRYISSHVQKRVDPADVAEEVKKLLK